MFRKFSRIFSFIIIMVMCVSILAGCREIEEKIPTPDELIVGAFGGEEVKSLRTNITTDIAANIDLSSLGMSGNIVMSCRIDAKMGGNVNGSTFVDGNIEYNMLSMNGSEKVKHYEIVDEFSTKVYTFNEDTNSWEMQYSVVKNGEYFIKSIVDIVSVENFTDGSLMVEINENSYIVKGVINSANLKNSLETLNRLIGSKNLISNDISFNVTMEFDKLSKNIQSITLILNTEIAPEPIKTAYNNLTLDIKICEINTANIEVPQEILNNMDINSSNLEESKTRKVEDVENNNSN